MTKEEIKALIDAKIAGQGSAVDVGSALPAILNGILDLAVSGGERTVIECDETFEQKSAQYALGRIKINGNPVSSIEDIKRAISGNTIITFPSDYSGYEFRVAYMFDNKDIFEVTGGSYTDDWGASFYIKIDKVNDDSKIQLVER